MPPRTQGFIKGAMILTAAAVAVKILGMLFKIPLQNILGAVGMSYFNSAYSIFTPIYALSVSGLPVAVSKLVSEQSARGGYLQVRKIRRVSFVLFLVFGLGGMLLLFFGANFFSGVIGNPGAALSVAAIAPSILFCCLVSSYRGYYQGLGNMTPTAVSQVVETAAKLLCGIALAMFAFHRGLSEFAQAGTVFGQYAPTAQQANLLVLPWAAAGAVMGVTLSTAVGWLYLLLRHAFKGDGISKGRLEISPPAQPSGKIAGSLLKIALPVCLSAAFTHLTNLIDLATIMNRVSVAVARDPVAMMGMYAGLLHESVTQAGLPAYLYGVFAYTTSLYHLPAAITVTLGVSALPSISARWALGDRSQLAEQAASVIKLSGLIAIPAGLGLFALSEPILTLLLPAQPQDVPVAAVILRGMAIAAILLAITTPMASIFQAVGRADIPLKLIAAGAAIKLTSNWVLLAIPELNIRAAPYGTILCYGFVLVAGCMALNKVVGRPVKVARSLARPLLCGILCAIAANTSYELLSRVMGFRVATLLAIAISAGVYAIFVLFMKIITKNEAMLLPKGKKVVKILEKLALLR